MPAGIFTSSRCSFLDAITRIPILYTCTLSLHCQAGEEIELPDCPEQPSITFLVSLTGLECCSLSLLFQEDFSRLCLPWGDQVCAGFTPGLPLQLTDGGAPSSGPPAVQPLSIFASSHEPTSLNSVCKCILIVQTAWASCWTLCKASSIFYLPDRQTPGLPCCVGHFFWPLTLGFPLLFLERNKAVLAHLGILFSPLTGSIL